MVGPEQLIIPILSDMYQWGKGQVQRLRKPGMYEVLNYESTIEILDPKGKQAIFSKVEELKILQDNVIAIQDQAWGDGKILLDYQCTPGVPVDFYRSGHKTYILISLRDVKQKGNQANFQVQWKIKNGFLKPMGYWATDVNHYTQKIKVVILFPKERKPLKLVIVETNRQKTKELPKESITQLPDKRWQVTWEKRNPRLYEHYILKWEW
ncbi:MAG: hypothetical protein Q7J07_06670 [Pelolinea sp.]|nr:hypothetical protein [Pelolinea sp.]